MNHFLSLAALLAGAACGLAADRPDILIADFEGDTYGDWKTEGEAFGNGPAKGTLPNQMPVSGFLGKGLVNSYKGGDDTTGTLTSPSIKVERKYIRFLVGGGKYEGKTCINLMLDGKVVRTATGPNDKPGGSEALDWHQWDVAELEGKAVVIQIVDQATGGWGHINVDHILQTDKKLSGFVENARREFAAEKRYLNLPVKTGAKKRRMSLIVGNETMREFEIELADSKPEFWVPLEVWRWKGKTVALQVDRLPEDSQALAQVEQADKITGAEDLYREKLRPQFHFTAQRGWLNDPNGLVFCNGAYHLFFQHNPYGRNWGNMHWGHAVSKDLVHWKEGPIALYPKSFDDWAFSGSAVVDRDNTAGFKKGDLDPIVVAWTSTGRGECIAYSLDNGKTFTEYEGNPVVKHQGRDPKLIWHAPTKRWVMAVYDEQGKSQGIAFYTSPDLKKWERQSRIEGWFECPEIFEMPVDGDPKNTRWVVYAADNEYAIGTFDGKVFKQESGKHKGNCGNCLYAAQTFNNIPANDGRRIQIGWARVDLPGMPFNQMMTFPVELTLRKTEDGLRLFANPVRELKELHGIGRPWRDVTIADVVRPAAEFQSECFRIRAEFVPSDAKAFGVTVRGVPVTYDAEKQTLTCKNATAPLKPDGGKVRLDILVDRASIEVFANDGRVYMPVGVLLPEKGPSLEAFARGGQAKASRLEVYELKSAWE